MDELELINESMVNNIQELEELLPKIYDFKKVIDFKIKEQLQAIISNLKTDADAVYRFYENNTCDADELSQQMDLTNKYKELLKENLSYEQIQELRFSEPELYLELNKRM